MDKSMTKNKITVFCLLFFVFLSSGTFAHKVNITNYDAAKLCLNQSTNILISMNKSNFSVNRISDKLDEAKSLFNAQEVLKKQRRNTDFTLIFPYCKKIAEIQKLALKSADDFNGLIKFRNTFVDDGMNTTKIDKTFAEIRNEIASERYEQVAPLIKNGYDEIVNAREENTALNLFYKTTTEGTKEFFLNNWKLFTISITLFIIFILLYETAIRRWIIREKIKKLKIKREIFNKLIGRAQKDYFETGKMSENEYTVKTKKFSEMVRDIDRQIPLLKEHYMKIAKSGDIKQRNKKSHKNKKWRK